MTTSLRARLLAMLVPLSLVAAACGDGGADTTAAPSSDGPVEFTAAQLDGGEFDSASIDGKDTVLWFWAPWCTTCRAEAPDVLESAAEFEGSVQVIGVAGRGEVADMEGFVSDTGTGSLPHLVDDDGSIWSQFEIISQPAFAFIDDSGEVEVFSGALGQEALSERMQALAAA